MEGDLLSFTASGLQIIVMGVGPGVYKIALDFAWACRLLNNWLVSVKRLNQD